MRVSSDQQQENIWDLKQVHSFYDGLRQALNF